MPTHAAARGAGVRRALAASVLALAAVQGCSDAGSRGRESPPVVAGLASSGLDARGRGLVLLEELGCVACHAPSATTTVAAGPGPGPDLTTVGQRVRPAYLTEFLADPVGCDPGTTMPDLLRDLPAEARANAASALAHYVASFAPPVPAVDEPADAAAAERGEQLFHSIGCAMCHVPRQSAAADGAAVDGVPFPPLADKYTLPALRTFLLAPLVARPSGHMPDSGLTPGEAQDLAHYLLASEPRPAVAVGSRPAPDAATIAAGRTLFAAHGCANCHALPDPLRGPTPPRRALHELDAARGCLSGHAGPWPFYALSPQQRTDLATALATWSAPTPDEQRIRQLLAARNCTACHARDDIGGVSQERDFLCTSNEVGIGEESRLPPRLTGVGAKLQRAWLHDAMAHGQRERPYLRTRMPAFGTAVAGELAELLSRADTLPPLALAPLPEGDRERRVVLDLGKALVGDKGMNCIACHTFAGERAGSLAAIDLVATTGLRLQPQWFAHFLRTPLRFSPGTLMPQFFPDGRSIRPELGDGDAARQIEAMWHYLAEGRNVDKPSGMRRPPIVLEVGDEAVLLRRSVERTGKRGIAVGYPHGVNATFDAERLAMNQIWWGGFVDAAPVWTSQGSGAARLVGKERVELPNGPAFVVLASPEAPWPAATRRELGHRWLGYDLDAQQRPTFRYTSGDVTIEDHAREVLAEGAPAGSRPLLRRTLRCRSDAETTLTFRAARDARIDDLGDGGVQVGDSLRLRLPGASFRIRQDGDARELLVALAVVRGSAECTIEYRWLEGGK